MSLLYQTNRCLSEFSTFGIGGPIRYFVEISSSAEMEEAFSFARSEKIPFWVIGKGSNSLFPDEGFQGLVLLNKIDFCTWADPLVTVGAGYSFSLLGAQAARRGLAGLEFASGIPASVGGAIFMNAGANGKETANNLVSVLYLNEEGKKRDILRKELSFGYRTSPFQSMRGAILEASFAFIPSLEARQKQLSLIEHRKRTQPLKEKSAGCVFRNPSQGVGAGALIEQCGLKGFSIGGAKVSELHANFIVNAGKAQAKDVLALMEEIQERVYTQTGIRLEAEIRIFHESNTF